jgi:hypothetical protein
MTDPVQNLPLSVDDTNLLKALLRAIHKIQDIGNFESSNKSLNSAQQQDSIYFTADELADHLGISIKTVYYRSAPNSKNPFPFKVIRVGGRKRGRLRFKKSHVEAAIRRGVI